MRTIKTPGRAAAVEFVDASRHRGRAASAKAREFTPQRRVSASPSNPIAVIREIPYRRGETVPAAEQASRDDKRALWYLRKVPFFEGMPPQQLSELVADIEIREIRRRQIIYLPGDPGDRVFFINGGRVKCSKVSRDGKELTLAYRGAGQLFGELCVFEAQPREEMAEAMKNEQGQSAVLRAERETRKNA